MLLPSLALLGGLILLVWSADKFIDGASAAASQLGMPPLLIGMLVVGFGTSAPEMAVSALSALQGNPGVALGNAYGSNIANIGLILGITALYAPLTMNSSILRKELPVLLLVTALAGALIYDEELSRMDAWMHLGLFALLTSWSVFQGMRNPSDALAEEIQKELAEHPMPLKKALFWLLLGLCLLLLSSRVLVWGAVEIALAWGLSDLVIGLTVIAVGTSLPELASSIAAVKKGEDDIALGNIMGSNMFNILAVVGIAGAIHPSVVPPELFSRDLAVMAGFTLALVLIGIGYKGSGKINRIAGLILLAAWISYTVYLLKTSVPL